MNNEQTNWRPTSIIPETGKDILLELKDRGTRIGYYSDAWYCNVYHKDDVVTGISTPERNVLGWLPIPTPPIEKII